MITSPSLDSSTSAPSPRSRLRRRLAGLVAVCGLVVTGGVLAAAPADAATPRNGVCDSGEFCLFFNSGEHGSVSDFTTSVPNYGTSEPSCYDFKGRGAGRGLCVKNHAASVWNRTGKTVTVFYNSNYDGTHAQQSFAPGARADLKAGLKNENASHRIGGGSGSGSSSGKVTGAQAVARAKVWSDEHIPYSMGRTHQGYRTDCSGYVSMAWGLAKPGLTTDRFHSVGHTISKGALQKGDALLNPRTGASGHIVLFEKWANAAHTKYWGYEESGSHGAIHRVITYPYFPGYGTFTPFHFNGLK